MTIRAVDERYDPGGRSRDVTAKRGRNRRDRRMRALGIDRKRAVEQRVRVQSPQHDVRVGDGRSVPVAVAGRSGVGAGR